MKSITELIKKLSEINFEYVRFFVDTVSSNTVMLVVSEYPLPEQKLIYQGINYFFFPPASSAMDDKIRIRPEN